MVAERGEGIPEKKWYMQWVKEFEDPKGFIVTEKIECEEEGEVE